RLERGRSRRPPRSLCARRQAGGIPGSARTGAPRRIAVPIGIATAEKGRDADRGESVRRTSTGWGREHSRHHGGLGGRDGTKTIGRATAAGDENGGDRAVGG